MGHSSIFKGHIRVYIREVINNAANDSSWITRGIIISCGGNYMWNQK
jgi:hypothetical protein